MKSSKKIEVGKIVKVRMDDKGRIIPLNGKQRRFLGIPIKKSREYEIYKKLKGKSEVECWVVMEIKEIRVESK
jgi:hypothetical protein